jgi:hypothetical protein
VNEASDPDRYGAFEIVTGSINVDPSVYLPPTSLGDDFELADDGAITGLEAYEIGFGTAFFDMDNDADQDLYWLGSLDARGEGPAGDSAAGFGRMLQNTGSGDFRDITVESRVIDALAVDYLEIYPDAPDLTLTGRRLGPEYRENGKGVAIGDLNGDGLLDIIGTNSNGETFDRNGDRTVVGGPLFVWLNSGTDNHWISFRLTGRMAVDGTGSNADAIGANIIVTHPSPDHEPFSQVKTVLGSSSSLSMSSTDVHFGLGGFADAGLLTVRIEWPSGIVSVLEDLEFDRLHEITEPAN